VRGQGFKKESTFSQLHFNRLFLRQMTEQSQAALANRNKAVPYHLPAPLRLFNTIYFKQMRMCFGMVGSGQLKRIKQKSHLSRSI
jgi:hypothetical protein